MSAPVTHDPLVVNTRGGGVWQRRAVTSDGRGLYASAGSCRCPESLMVPLAELAEHGIVGSADVLPVPVGPEQPVDADRAKAPWGRGEDGLPLLPMGVHWTDVPELVDKTVAKIQVRVDGATSGHWYDASVTETWRAPGTVRTNVDGYQVGVGQFIARPGDMELVLHAHDDLSWLLEMVAKFRARVAELEAQRATVYRVVDGVTTIALYTSAGQARKHCEFLARRENRGGATQELFWRLDEDTAHLNDGPELLMECTAPGFSRLTGFGVSPVPLSSLFVEAGES